MCLGPLRGLDAQLRERDLGLGQRRRLELPAAQRPQDLLRGPDAITQLGHDLAQQRLKTVFLSPVGMHLRLKEEVVMVVSELEKWKETRLSVTVQGIF